MSQALGEIPDLAGQLPKLLGQIPRGRVTTYGALADALGNRIAARWVGYFLLHHEHHQQCVCHRVVRAGGELGQFIAGSEALKSRLLLAEGVDARSGRVDLRRFGFERFVGDRPLERLKRVQTSWSAWPCDQRPAAGGWYAEA